MIPDDVHHLIRLHRTHITGHHIVLISDGVIGEVIQGVDVLQEVLRVLLILVMIVSTCMNQPIVRDI